MTAILHVPQPAPAWPLNLELGVVYAPRVETPPFVAFRAIERAPDQFQIEAFDEAGRAEIVFRGPIGDTFWRLAAHLRLDTVPANAVRELKR